MTSCGLARLSNRKRTRLPFMQCTYFTKHFRNSRCVSSTNITKILYKVFLENIVGKIIMSGIKNGSIPLVQAEVHNVTNNTNWPCSTQQIQFVWFFSLLYSRFSYMHMFLNSCHTNFISSIYQTLETYTEVSKLNLVKN